MLITACESRWLLGISPSRSPRWCPRWRWQSCSRSRRWHSRWRSCSWRPLPAPSPALSRGRPGPAPSRPHHFLTTLTPSPRAVQMMYPRCPLCNLKLVLFSLLARDWYSRHKMCQVSRKDEFQNGSDHKLISKLFSRYLRCEHEVVF